MPYRVFRDDGAPLDAHLDIEGREFVFHSRGGTKGTAAAHNIDYGPGLRLLLQRIVRTGRRVEIAWLDSDEVAYLPRDTRVILDGAGLEASPAEQFRIMSAAMKAFGRPVGAPPGGSPVKKLRIRVTGDGDDELARDLGVGYVSRDGPRPRRLPASVMGRVTAEHIWNAVQHLSADPLDHPFGEATDFELVGDDGVRLPPKAVFGRAATEALGFPVRPGHFSGGKASQAHRALEDAGFHIVPRGDLVRPIAVPLSNEDREWTEGRPKLVLHLRKERAAGLSRAKKEHFIARHGGLKCERCGLDPVAVFGANAGPACIEVHHRDTQVSKMDEGHRTRLEDLECLCANCHRIVHALLKLGLPIGGTERRGAARPSASRARLST